MNKTGIVIILLCFLAAAAVVLLERRKTRKTMEEIERMLDAAMTGSFSETNFDESQLSALETKFAHYLSAAEASSRNIAQEKDKIKTLIADISPDENADCKPAVIQRASDGGNSACIGEGKCGGAVQTIGKAAISDRFSRKAFQTGKRDRKSTRLNSSHDRQSRMPSSA